MFFANLARELYDKELSLTIPITTLNQDFTDLLKKYCIVMWPIKD